MSPSLRLFIYVISLVSSGMGCLLLLKWLAQTDFMGHYSGPPMLIRAAVALLAVGAMTGTLWYGDGLRLLSRVPSDADTKRFTPAGIAKGVALFPLVAVAVCAVGLTMAQIAEKSQSSRKRSQAPVREKTSPTNKLITDLESDEVFTRENAAIQLRSRGHEIPEAIPALRKAAQDPDPMVRTIVADALWKLSHNANDVVPVLISVLEMENAVDNVRGNAIHQLYVIGPRANAAIPVLEDIVENDPNEFLRTSAQDALKRIHEE